MVSGKFLPTNDEGIFLWTFAVGVQMSRRVFLINFIYLLSLKLNLFQKNPLCFVTFMFFLCSVVK